jgi:transmembrane sensor
MKTTDTDMGNPLSRKLEDDQRLAERAAEWLSVLENAGPAERAEFADWLTTSPRHAEEMLVITALMSELERMPLEKFPGVRHRLATTVSNIVPVPVRRPRALVGSRWRNDDKRGARGFRWLVAGIAVAAMGGMLAWWWAASRPLVYATTIGEQRTIRLRDGSTIDLNTQSLVQVRFSRHAREVRLIEGEALFAVRHDPDRPFKVATDMAVVQAVGTRFDVYRRESATTVSVVDGRVNIEAPQELPSVPLQLAAGDLANIASDGRVDKRTDPGGVRRRVAWREHRLIFLSETLSNVAKEFNRYNQVPKILVRGEAAQRRYSGVFDSNDPQSLLEFLREDSELIFAAKGHALVVEPRQQPETGR